MPERLSGQDRKLARLGVLSEIGSRNTQAAAAQQGQLMQQLAQMYQLSSQAEMDPVRLEQMQLQNKAMPAQLAAQELANKGEQFKQAWAQPMAEQQYNLQGAQAQALQQRASPQAQAIDMADMYGRTTGVIPPWLEQMLMPPEMRKQIADQAAAKEAEKAAAQQQIDNQEWEAFLASGDKYDPTMQGSTPGNIPPLPQSPRGGDFLRWLGEFVRKNPPTGTLTGGF